MAHGWDSTGGNAAYTPLEGGQSATYFDGRCGPAGRLQGNYYWEVGAVFGNAFLSLRVRAGITAAASAVVLGVTATAGQASTLAYVNFNDNNVYVASSTGTDVHEVATGVTSPSLAANGDLYALAGNQVDVFAPATGAQTPIPITGSDPTQLSVSRYGTRFAWTDGTPVSENTTVTDLDPSSGVTSTFMDANGPYYIGPYRFTLSEYDINNPATSSVVITDGASSRTLWSPDSGLQGPEQTIVYEYAPNPAHTEAAAVVLTETLHSISFDLIVFPIKDLAPTGNPLVTNAFCDIDEGDVNPSPQGQTFAWAPSGSTLAFGSDEGIKEVSVGPWNSNCSQIGTPQVVIPDGYEPSWGPSNRRDFPAPASGS